MVSSTSIEEQLKKISFNQNRWNRAECLELAAIILPDEKIFECVNGWYENGIALLCATDIRILLIDKKLLKFLTVEDLRFDTINQIDYSHRLMDAKITVSAGMKSLNFRSYNKPRLRKLIGHVQHRMAEIKAEQAAKAQDHQDHLMEIDQKLQAYLMAQYQQHESMSRQVKDSSGQIDSLGDKTIVSPISQAFYRPPIETPSFDISSIPLGYADSVSAGTDEVSADELFNEGLKEVFSKRQPAKHSHQLKKEASRDKDAEINPLGFAYSQTISLLKNRNYGRVVVRPNLLPPE